MRPDNYAYTPLYSEANGKARCVYAASHSEWEMETKLQRVMAQGLTRVAIDGR
jgi:hypothetical protein